jgi:hypothetical protein
MGDDVIEFADVIRRSRLREIAAAKLHVLEPSRARQRTTTVDRCPRNVQPDNVRAGKRLRDRQRVRAIAATQLKHPSVGSRRWGETKQAAYRLKARRVRRRVRIPGIGELLVCAARFRRLAQRLKDALFVTWFQVEVTVLELVPPAVGTTTLNSIFW